MQCIGNDYFFGDFEAYMKDSIDIDGINVILFVMRKGRLTHEEQKVFALFKHIERISSFSALAITGFEADSTEVRTEFVEEFKVHETTRQIAAQMKKGIYPVGFPSVNRMPPALRNDCLSQMMEDQCTLLNMIVQADKSLSKKKFIEQTRRIPKQALGCTLH